MINQLPGFVCATTHINSGVFLWVRQRTDRPGTQRHYDLYRLYDSQMWRRVNQVNTTSGTKFNNMLALIYLRPPPEVFGLSDTN